MTSFFSKKSLAIIALLEVSLFWGLCWVGYRQLHEFGMSGMAAGVSTRLWRRSLRGCWRGVLCVKGSGARCLGLFCFY